MRHEKNGMEWVDGHDQFIKNLLNHGDNAMRMNDYAVEITGTFRKTITVSAPNQDEAAMAVEDNDWKLNIDDVVDYEIEDIYPE